jgi:6,7-dimethyl-8-ribityllumazine synthase
MAEDVKGAEVPPPELDGRGLRVAVVVARFNSHVTTRLLDAATARLGELGVTEIDVSWVPGAFEVPAAAQYHATSGADAVLALGCVIRGETSHYDFVAGQAAAGIMRVGLDTGVPVVFGVLTTEDLHQALVRSALPGEAGHNAGADGAAAAVEMALLHRRLT